MQGVNTYVVGAPLIVYITFTRAQTPLHYPRILFKGSDKISGALRAPTQVKPFNIFEIIYSNVQFLIAIAM